MHLFFSFLYVLVTFTLHANDVQPQTCTKYFTFCVFMAEIGHVVREGTDCISVYDIASDVTMAFQRTPTLSIRYILYSSKASSIACD